MEERNCEAEGQSTRTKKAEGSGDKVGVKADSGDEVGVKADSVGVGEVWVEGGAEPLSSETLPRPTSFQESITALTILEKSTDGSMFSHNLAMEAAERMVM